MQQQPVDSQWSRGSSSNRGSGSYDRGDNRPQQQPVQQYDSRWNGTSGRAGADRNRADDNRNNRGSYDDRSGRGMDNRGSYDRDNRGSYNRGHDNRGSYDRGNRGSYNRGGYDRGHNMVGQGRVSRIFHERGGYRVWLDGGRYPYWIPEARFRLFPLRVGLSIRFGGLWDPLGYWNVYDMGPMNGPYYTSGSLSGVVESVDYRRGSLVLRDDVSGNFVTVALTGNDSRLGDLRRGDYVDLSGAWSRGIFEAYNLDGIRGGYGDRYGDGGYGY